MTVRTLLVRMGNAAQDMLCALRLRTGPASWALPGQVLACAYPTDENALARLEAMGVKLIVNLHARPHTPAALSRHGFVELHLPTPESYKVTKRCNGHAPEGNRLQCARLSNGDRRTGGMICESIFLLDS